MMKRCNHPTPCCGWHEDNICHYMGKCEHQFQTNADRIRSMSDEELAEFIGVCGLCCQIQKDDGDWCARYAVCEHCVVNWLQQPAKECE